MDRAGLIRDLFGARRALIGVIHLQALPGTSGGRLVIDAIAEAAVAEARRYVEAGFHGLMIENTHDRPYLKGSVGPEIVAAMAAVAREVHRTVPAPLGVQVLAGANRESIAVALACGAAFVRAEGFVFAHVADEGLIESSAGDLLRYRRAIGAEGIRVWVDVKKKHSAHALTADVDLVETAHAAEFFLADAVIVTGAATGRPASPGEVRAVSHAVSLATVVGSGVTPENLAEYAAADAFIVGSSVKRDGLWSNPLDASRLQAVVRAFAALPPAADPRG
jgi:membrane complex biogenesis BtpA family protein